MSQGTGKEEKSFSFDDAFVHLGIILKHTRLIVLSGCLVLVLGLLYFCYAKPVYEAKSLVKCVYVADPLDRQRGFGERPGWLALRENLPSELINRRAAKRLGIDAGFGKIRKDLVRRVRVYKDQGGESVNDELIRVEVHGYKPNLVNQWSKALVEEYVDFRKEKRDAIAFGDIGKWEEDRKKTAQQIINLKQEQVEVEDQLQYDRLKSEMTNLNNLQNQITQNNQRLQLQEKILSELLNVGLDVVQKFSLLSSYKDSELKTGQTISMPLRTESNGEAFTEPQQRPDVVVTPEHANLDDRAWIKLYQDVKALRQEYQRQSAVFLPGHPSMKKLGEELKNAELLLDRQFETAHDAFLLSHSKTVNEGTRLRDQLPRLRELTRTHQVALQAISGFQEKIKDLQKRHDKLRDKIEQIRLSHTIDPFLEISYVGQVGDSRLGSIAPNKGKLLIYCMGGAFLLGIGLAYLMEYMDSSVKTPENVEAELQIHGLGLVPELPPNIDGDSLAISEEYPMFKESYRVIRTNLVLRREDQGNSQIIMVSSSMPQEGKSMNSLELARSFAEMGERTLLIDADLRRGKQTRKIIGKKVFGLADFLTGNSQVSPMQFEDKLDFLPSGKYSATAIENLGGDSIQALMLGLRMQYDRIIIDGPPLLGLPDVFMMSHSVDGIVLIISAGRTVFPQVRLAVDQILKSHVPIFGFILNRVNFRTGGKYYRYYYRNYEYYQQGRQTGGLLSDTTSTIS